MATFQNKCVQVYLQVREFFKEPNVGYGPSLTFDPWKKDTGTSGKKAG